MDMTHRNINIINQTMQNNTSDVQVEVPKRMGLWERLFATNWGIVRICGLVAIGIGVATIHAGQVEATASVPDVASETAMVMPVE